MYKEIIIFVITTLLNSTVVILFVQVLCWGFYIWRLLYCIIIQ